MEAIYVMFLESAYSKIKTFQIAKMSEAYFLLQNCVGRERTCAIIRPEAEARHFYSARGKTSLEVNLVFVLETGKGSVIFSSLYRGLCQKVQN